MSYSFAAFLILVFFLRTLSTALTIFSSLHPLYTPRLTVAALVSGGTTTQVDLDLIILSLELSHAKYTAMYNRTSNHIINDHGTQSDSIHNKCMVDYQELICINLLTNISYPQAIYITVYIYADPVCDPYLKLGCDQVFPGPKCFLTLGHACILSPALMRKSASISQNVKVQAIGSRTYTIG